MINIEKYSKIPTLKILHSLKNHQENEIIYCEEDSKLYCWENNDWTPLKIENNGIKMSLYDFNKNIISQLTPFSLEDLSMKTPLLEEFFQQSYNIHYMLLCSEYNYYTIFESDSALSLPTFSGAICSILFDLGEIYSLEKTKDATALEIWIKPKDKDEPMVFYLFPYDQGVIYYG